MNARMNSKQGREERRYEAMLETAGESAMATDPMTLDASYYDAMLLGAAAAARKARGGAERAD